MGTSGAGEARRRSVDGDDGLAEGGVDRRGRKVAVCSSRPQVVVGGGRGRGRALAWERDTSHDNGLPLLITYSLRPILLFIHMGFE